MMCFKLRKTFITIIALGLFTLTNPFFVSQVQDVMAQEKVYTCSMHPQVRLPNPGSCPICSMPLIPAERPTGEKASAGTIELSDHALAMASVETAPVERKALSHVVRAVGKIAYDETSLATITSRVDGYAERLFVNFTGVGVNKGDHLAEVYSPDLVVAQQELLVAAGGARPELLTTTKLKLHRLGLTDGQIAELLEKRKVTERITLLSPIEGTVILRNVTQNASFKSGDILYQIANLDTVWAYLDIYESQLPWLRYGQHVTMTTEAIPGRTVDGKVTFISPIVDDETRTIKVPVHIENKDHLLKPGMFVSADIHASLDSAGGPGPTGAEGSFTCPMHPQVIQDSGGSCPLCGMDLKKVPGVKVSYTCPMHPQVIQDSGGSCPLCGMNLEKVPGVTGKGLAQEIISVPASAVLDSGSRKLVYVEKKKGTFESRVVTLGPKAGDLFPVLSGLSEGERVAVRGNFLLDSQAQISGSPSLFYPQGAASSIHQHEESGAQSNTSDNQDSAPTMSGHKH
jgi:Cu(I)/Ag(I) efflux system membrane fusion protein